MLANLCPECFAERDVQFTDPQAALNHAMGLHQAGRFADAAGIYQRLLELIPDSHDVRHLQGLALFDLGRPDEGIRLMEEALPGIPAPAITTTTSAHASSTTATTHVPSNC